MSLFVRFFLFFPLFILGGRDYKWKDSTMTLYIHQSLGKSVLFWLLIYRKSLARIWELYISKQVLIRNFYYLDYRVCIICNKWYKLFFPQWKLFTSRFSLANEIFFLFLANRKLYLLLANENLELLLIENPKTVFYTVMSNHF